MPRAGLNEARVVEEAERLADEVGLDKLTLAVLADRLGVRQPSLYKHVAGLEAVHRLISIRAKRELAVVFARAAVGRARGDAIVALAKAYRKWALLYPARYLAAQRAPVTDDLEDIEASTDVVHIAFDVVAGYGLSDDDAVDAVRALRATLHGFVMLESSGGFGLPVSIDRSFDRLVMGLIAVLDRWHESTGRRQP